MINRANAGGKLIFLPIDHGLEHGPSDFFERPKSEHTRLFLSKILQH